VPQHDVVVHLQKTMIGARSCRRRDDDSDPGRDNDLHSIGPVATMWRRARTLLDSGRFSAFTTAFWRLILETGSETAPVPSLDSLRTKLDLKKEGRPIMLSFGFRKDRRFLPSRHLSIVAICGNHAVVFRSSDMGLKYAGERRIQRRTVFSYARVSIDRYEWPDGCSNGAAARRLSTKLPTICTAVGSSYRQRGN
jgi:hypothetical protein